MTDAELLDLFASRTTPKHGLRAVYEAGQSARTAVTDRLPGALWLAMWFHDTYESLAPQFGYETKPETRLFEATSPNGKLMIAVCEKLREALGAVPSAGAPLIPSDNDGKEQDAFEAWAKANGFDITTHPLHWLFLDKRTYAARDGWRGALQYVAKVTALLPTGAERYIK